jgi:hypothetical protein
MAISSVLGSSALLPAGLGFRNLVINGGMDVWQRGTSFTNPASGSGYTADRMFPVYDGSGATRTISQGQFDPYLSGASITATPPAGTSPTYFLRWNQSVAGTGGSYNILYANRVENVRLLAGKTFTLSFYAKAGASLTMPLIDMEQSFGSGGSPSSNVYTTVTSNIAVTTSWQRFTYTFVMPTPFEQRPIGVELALCQRYYYSSYSNGVAINGADTISGHHQGIGVDTASVVMSNGTFAVPMRATPTVNVYQPRGGVGSGSIRNHSSSGTDITGMTVIGVNNRGLGYIGNTGAIVLGYFYGMEMTANAEL